MKRNRQQASSKSGTPKGTIPKRTKYDSKRVVEKIQKWRSSSSINVQPSDLATKLWSKIDKSDPEAVKHVLALHADGKGGDKDALYFSSSRFWHLYKILKDELLSYFALSLWSVRLEAAHLSGNSVLVGDDNVSIINFKKFNRNHSISTTLYELDTVGLAHWYEVYYNLTFGKISLSDNTEINRNAYLNDSDSMNAEMLHFDRNQNETLSIEVQPPDESDLDLEQSIQELYNQLDRTRPRFLYVEKAEFENIPIGDRVVIVLNVMSDVEYALPLGWSYEPFTHTPSFCIPLHFFEDLGVYQQIALAQTFLTFAGDVIPNTADKTTDTNTLIRKQDSTVQTDFQPQVKLEYQDLESPH